MGLFVSEKNKGHVKKTFRLFPSIPTAIAMVGCRCFVLMRLIDFCNEQFMELLVLPFALWIGHIKPTNGMAAATLLVVLIFFLPYLYEERYLYQCRVFA